MISWPDPIPTRQRILRDRLFSDNDEGDGSGDDVKPLRHGSLKRENDRRLR